MSLKYRGIARQNDSHESIVILILKVQETRDVTTNKIVAISQKRDRPIKTAQISRVT